VAHPPHDAASGGDDASNRRQAMGKSTEEQEEEQGLPLLLPSMTFDDGDSVMYGWLRFMMREPIHKELMRMIVSFL